MRKTDIFVQTMDGKWRKKLYNGKLITPRALVAVPTIGQIYGSDWSSKAFIYKAAMDGHKFEKIVTDGVVRHYFVLRWCASRQNSMAITGLAERTNSGCLCNEDVLGMGGIACIGDDSSTKIFQADAFLDIIEWATDPVHSYFN